MPHVLNLKPSHKAVRQYYADLRTFAESGADKETSVRTTILELLTHCARRCDWHLLAEYGLSGKGDGRFVDAALLDKLNLPRGYCEAKDDADDLDQEIRQKIDDGYPDDNILFWQPSRAVLYQDKERVFDEPIDDPQQLIAALELLFSYANTETRDWSGVVDEFREVIPELGRKLVELIEEERRGNRKFVDAFESFGEVIREAVNPNLSDAALEEMLIQHILTERIFRNVFDNPDFVQRNAIANEIEKVVTALTGQAFSKTEFMKPLERFYAQLEATARTIHDFGAKQTFLNTVYERFFQGFSVKVADTLGVVYTPQAIVEFIVNSVESLLQREFGLSMSSEGVHILDPFVGTGNFIVRAMRHLEPAALPRKYKSELHCNELMLLPYYIASLNIEHEYVEQTRQYRPFEGICLVDTFALAEPRQAEFSFLTEENTQRVEAQRQADIMVILGNPPYNANQVNENDNNKNRRYPTIDGRVRDTYAKDSKATNKNKTRDPYVKAFRWASDRLRATGKPRGIVAFVSNNSFIDDYSLDGMRRHLARDFDKLYVLDLGGNVRKNPKLSGTTHNVFGIQVGVAISLLVRTEETDREIAGEIYYARVGENWRREEKYRVLNRAETVDNVEWKQLTATTDQIWLSEGMADDFDAFPPIGTQEVKALDSPRGETDTAGALFKTYSNGVKTNRDPWVYNFDGAALDRNVRATIEVYNRHVDRWPAELAALPNDATQADARRRVDDFVESDEQKISWSRDLKLDLMRGHKIEFQQAAIRSSLYRPFCKANLYLDRILNEEVYQFPSYIPTVDSEAENVVLCMRGVGGRADFYALATNRIPCLDLTSIDRAQCFPFYTYDEDGTNRRENVTDWALARYRARYGKGVSKWDIFHYVYGLLHHPDYAERYAANLRRSLPHIPDVTSNEAFRGFVAAGERLAELHVNYEQQPPHPGLRQVWQDGRQHDLRVERMKLSKDRRSILYNDALVIENIPPQVFDYRLGSRSALEWVIDQYRVKTDKASGIVNDPNRPDDPGYIIDLVGRVVTVSLETVKIVNALPPLDISPPE